MTNDGRTTHDGSARIEGIDVARALAGIIMIQGHAYDGWASPAAKETFAYAFTRLLGSLPLPAFLLLAGSAVTLRVDAAIRKGESAHAVRRGVVKRGLQIVLYGYLVSVAFALMDGWESVDTLLRADVLHVIGLSIASIGFFGIRPASRDASPDGPPDASRLARTSLVIGVVATLTCPWVTRASVHTQGPLRYVVGLFADVPGVTLMPYVPLVAWFAVGVGAAQWMLRMRRATGDISRGGAPRRSLVALGALGLVLAIVGSIGTPLVTRLLSDTFGSELSRAHPAVWLNVVDLAGRALVVFAIGTLLANHVQGTVRRWLLRIGRGSLVAYIFHIPFCYGALARSIAGELDMLTATALLVVLYALSFAAVWARDALGDALAARFSSRSRSR